MATARPIPIVVDARGLRADATTIDLLARLELSARRLGRRMRLSGASDELRDLLALAGLDDVLGVEPGRQAEEGEQRLRVQEERELSDPAR